MDLRNAGYLTSNANTAWPLDPDVPGFQREASLLFADGAAILRTEEQGAEVYVDEILVESDAAESRMSFKAYKLLAGRALDETRFEFSVTDDSGVYEVGKSGWCFFVVEAAEIRKAGHASYGRFRLDPGAVSVEADKITSISLWNHYDEMSVQCGSNDESHTVYVPSDTLRITHSGIVGAVRVLAGTNMYVGGDLSMALMGTVTNPLSETQVDGIVIASEAGAGEGTVPCPPCSPECDSNDINGNVVPDAQGNVVIEADKCFQVSPDGVVRITGRCTACCQCDDFVAIGDRLAEQGDIVLDDYKSLIDGASQYNLWANKFNGSVADVREDELLVKCAVSVQKLDAGAAHSVQLKRISGSVDRSSAVITIVNLSSKDVDVRVYANMSPQPFILATVTRPVSTRKSSIKMVTDTVTSDAFQVGVPISLVSDDPDHPGINQDAVGKVLAGSVYATDHGSDDSAESYSEDDMILVAEHDTVLTEDDIERILSYGITVVRVYSPSPFSYSKGLPSGSAMNIRMYGAKNAKTPSSTCEVEGMVTFTWDSGAKSCVKTFSASRGDTNG